MKRIKIEANPENSLIDNTNYLIRTEIEVLPADKVKRFKLGWKVKEKIGPGLIVKNGKIVSPGIILPYSNPESEGVMPVCNPSKGK